ncbi:uncharacterized protein BO88DRAFT_150240 [Aspergillus vadensis CBS 113365]|uniref:Uncharacterized protein n=1 Tax=Aspergillus vadensis (strain CBS 113365 / IMI 142717 / IBT 24658) TaxID=1448311 RepID=A0A319C8K1_ASPVC|nr:hypothetical protein BO88DRAFT_150240 [Aspergillus vadensis CBS 113365]PYH65062.1 hypothetical protein BO88DRAFT_150240 [Aspergillus vadensis CBS 113365]
MTTLAILSDLMTSCDLSLFPTAVWPDYISLAIRWARHPLPLSTLPFKSPYLPSTYLAVVFLYLYTLLTLSIPFSLLQTLTELD